MADAGRFAVDVTELDSVIADMERTENDLNALAVELENQMSALQSVWEGLAADAQIAAQAEWEQGLCGMREAITELRAAARVAHENYTGAVAANLSMWEGLG